MAARQISDISIETEGGLTKSYAKSEWLIDEPSDILSIPKVAPGSVAYTADLSVMGMFDGTQWVQIGGNNGTNNGGGGSSSDDPPTGGDIPAV